MDKLEALRHYWDAYRPRQLRFLRLAREWMEAGIDASTAAAWANRGYLPTEAAPLIAAGVTPQMVAEMDDLATQIAGSQEERAAQVIDLLVAEGVLVDPRQVRVIRPQ